MDKSYIGEPEETVHERLELQDLAVRQVQEDPEGLQSGQQLQQSEDPVQNETSTPGLTHKLMQHEKEESAQKVKIRGSLQKSEENESSRQGCRELVEGEEFEQKTDGNKVVQQKDESSFAMKQDSRQTNQPDDDVMREECGVIAEDRLLESIGNTTVQRTDDAPYSLLHTLDQECVQVTRQGDNATHQDCDRSESLEPKSEANLTEKLRERTLEEILVALMGGPIQIDETNDGVQRDRDRTSENGHLEESESDLESENSCHVGLRTQQLDEEAALPLPSRICYHRIHTQRQRLPPVPEVPDEPLEPFEVEIPVRRIRRTLGSRMPTVPTGIRDYLQRVSEHHISPGRRERYAELQRRVVKLLCSIMLGAVLYVVMYLIVDFLENKYSNDGDSNDTSPGDFSDDLNITVTDFKPDTFVTDLEAKVTTHSINSWTGLDNEVTSTLSDMDGNGEGIAITVTDLIADPMEDLE